MKAMPISAQDKKWQAECDLRSLKEAEEVRKDPKRLAAAQRLATKEMQALQRVGKPIKAAGKRGK